VPPRRHADTPTEKGPPPPTPVDTDSPCAAHNTQYTTMKLPVGHVPGVGVHKATAYGGLGEKLLRGWGWEAGKGCGKDGQGLAKAIEVTKKEDNAGIGGNNRYGWEEKWWEAAFNANVQSIADRAASDSDSSDSDSECDSEDETQLTTCQAGLLRNRDGTITSASADELKISASVSKDARGWAGRFGGREGKMERIRRHEAEASERARVQLGLLPKHGGAEPKASPAGKAAEKAEVRSSKPKRKSTGEARTKAKKVKKAKKSSSAAEELPEAGPAAMSAFSFAAKAYAVHAEKQPVPQDKKWWGCNYFVSAGCLAGLEPAEEARKRQTFCEDDQEKLYHQTQDKKAAGRQGIGVRGSVIKIAGGKYEGTKVKFDDNDGGEFSGAAAPARADADQVASIKWKKLITTKLQEAPDGAMKVKKLQKQVATQALAKIGMDVCLEHLKEVVMQKLTSSSRFVVEGKLVRCC